MKIKKELVLDKLCVDLIEGCIKNMPEKHKEELYCAMFNIGSTIFYLAGSITDFKTSYTTLLRTGKIDLSKNLKKIHEITKAQNN